MHTVYISIIYTKHTSMHINHTHIISTVYTLLIYTYALSYLKEEVILVAAPSLYELLALLLCEHAYRVVHTYIELCQHLLEFRLVIGDYLMIC